MMMLSWLWGSVSSGIGRVVGIVLGVGLAVLAVFQLGRSNQKAKQASKDAKEYVKTRKQIDEAGNDISDTDDARRRLRDFLDK